MPYLKHLAVPILLLLLVQRSKAQFKILGIASGRSNSDDVAIVQIKPLQLHNSSVESVQARSFGEPSTLTTPSVAPKSIPSPTTTTTTTMTTTTALSSLPPSATVQNQTSKIIKLQIMDPSAARNISTREGKLQYDNHRTDNDIINIAPLRPTPPQPQPASPHRRRATGSIKLTGDSELFYIHKPSSPAPFKKNHSPNHHLQQQAPYPQSKENDLVADFVLQQRYKRRKYKSKCRCERIWNCPRIQISIARCAPDYFMCCF